MRTPHDENATQKKQEIAGSRSGSSSMTSGLGMASKKSFFKGFLGNRAD
jgi:hypothetical protein